MSPIVFCLLVFLSNSNGYVTSNFEYETTTKLTSLIDFHYNKYSEDSVHDDKNFSSYIYLDDVVFGLKSQNWTKEELPCLNETLHLIKSLQNYTLWAVWEWDSVASQPLGIMSGNRFQLGNFDQCMTTPWNTKHPEINSQYCLAEVVLEKTDGVKKKRLDEVKPYENALDIIEHHTPYYRPLKYLTWGACVPVSCEPRSVERLVGAVLARSHLGAAGLKPHITVNETCQRPDQPMQFDASFYAFFALTGFMFILCLLCTILNQVNNKRDNYRTKNINFYSVFSITENAKNLLTMKKDGIEVIYGIKYLTICFIVICHQAGIINSGPISNGIKVDENVHIIGWLMLHNDLLVDTFFVISGFLVAKALVQYKRLPNIFLMILRRYIRLVVALAVTVFFIAAVFPHTGSGPLWDRYVETESGSCSKNWWLNILMLSNYIYPENACLLVSWYIPCDFHYFLVVLLTYTLYRKYPKLGMFCAGALCVASIITPGIVNYVNKLGAIQLFTYEFVSNPRANEQFHKTYIKSHTRAAAYAVGFFAGYFFTSFKKKTTAKLSQAKSVITFCVGVAVMILVTMLGVSYHYRTYSQIEGAFYAALNRPIWAAGAVLMIFSCIYGRVPLMNAFLSWYPWVPLSRLAYGVYLVHTVIIIRNVAVTRNPVHYDNFTVLMISIAVIVLSTFLALVIWLLFEAPANNLLVFYFKKKQKHSNTEENHEGTVENVRACEDNGKHNSGYIEHNLTETIHFSSKM